MASLLKKIDATKLDTTKWPTVNEELLPEQERSIYVRRRDAVLSYLETGKPKEACLIGGFSRFELARLVKRCTATHPDGQVVGFRGCRPNFRVKSYVRKADGEGTAGLLSTLFRNYPEIESKLEDYALRRGDRLSLPSRIGLTDLRNKLLALCRDAGFLVTQYPLNVSEGGVRSLSKWRKRFMDTHARAYLKDQFGEEAARAFDGGWGFAQVGVDPHIVWVFDEYTLDTFVSIGIRQPDGSIKWLPMARFKVISGRRRGSRDILVCRAVLKTEPNTTDFLEAIEAAVRPHQRMKLDVPGFSYPKQPCFASEFNECDWALPSVIMLDNSKVHLSEANRSAITERLGCTVQFGVVRRPRARGDIESWHSYLAREFRKLASTTATGPTDTRRVDPEKAAVELRLEVSHIEQLLEMLAVRFNSRPLNSLKGKTPLEAFSLWARSDDVLVRRLSPSSREGFSIADKQVRVRISCDVSSGRIPVVRYQYADYVGPKLSHMRSRAGEECVLVLTPFQAHIAKLFAKDGTEIDTLRARGMWHAPHSLETRENFVAKRKRGEVADPGENETPTEVMRRALSQEAKSNKRAALSLARLEKDDAKRTEASEAAPAPAIVPVDTKPAGAVTPRRRTQRQMKSAGDW